MIAMRGGISDQKLSWTLSGVVTKAEMTRKITTATNAATVTLTVRVLFSITCFPFILTTVAFVRRKADGSGQSPGRTVPRDSFSVLSCWTKLL
jgi:uncharacterized membrane protein